MRSNGVTYEKVYQSKSTPSIFRRRGVAIKNKHLKFQDSRRSPVYGVKGYISYGTEVINDIVE